MEENGNLKLDFSPSEVTDGTSLLSNTENLSDLSLFVVNDLVHVMPRMWPGINKPGGVARVLKVHYVEDEDEFLYDVKYMIHTGRELKVPERFLKLYEEESGKRSTQGRCRLCGSFLKDCGHDEETIAREIAEARRKKEMKKKEKSTQIKPANMTYDETVMFIADNNKKEKIKQSGKKKKMNESAEQEFYSEIFNEDDALAELNMEAHEDSDDSEYVEEPPKAINNDVAIGNHQYNQNNEEDTQPQNLEIIDLVDTATIVPIPRSPPKASVPKPVVVTISDPTPTSKTNAQSMSILTIDEESKGQAKAIHKILYDNCLFRSPSEKTLYSLQLQRLKDEVTDLKILWTLINLCFNFIINISYKITDYLQETEEFYTFLQNYQGKNSSEKDKRKRKLEISSQSTIASSKNPPVKKLRTSGLEQNERHFDEENLQNTQVEEKMLVDSDDEEQATVTESVNQEISKSDIIEKLLSYQENHLIYFEQIEKSGIDIFNLSISRFKKYLKRSTVVIINKKQIKQKLEQLLLQVNVISLEISDQLKSSYTLLRELLESYEIIFNESFEDAVYRLKHAKQEPELELMQQTDDESEEEVEEELKKKANKEEEIRSRPPRIRDISAEAATIVKRKDLSEPVKSTQRKEQSKSSHAQQSHAMKLTESARKTSEKFSVIDSDQKGRLEKKKEIYDLTADDDHDTYETRLTRIFEKKKKQLKSSSSSKSVSSRKAELPSFSTTISSSSSKSQRSSKASEMITNSDLLDFLAPEDEFILLRMDKNPSLKGNYLKMKEIRKYFDKSTRKSSKMNSAPAFAESSIHPAPLNNTGIDGRGHSLLEESRHSAHSTKIPRFYRKLPMQRGNNYQENALYDGRVILLDFSDFIRGDQFLSKSNSKSNSFQSSLLHPRLSDLFLESTIPSIANCSGDEDDDNDDDDLISTLLHPSEQQIFQERRHEEREESILELTGIDDQSSFSLHQIMKQLLFFSQEFFPMKWKDEFSSSKITNFLIEFWNTITFSKLEMKIINEEFLYSFNHTQKRNTFIYFLEQFIQSKLSSNKNYPNQLSLPEKKSHRISFFQFHFKLQKILFSKEMELFYFSKFPSRQKENMDNNNHHHPEKYIEIEYIEMILQLSSTIEREFFHLFQFHSSQEDCPMIQELKDIFPLLFPPLQQSQQQREGEERRSQKVDPFKELLFTDSLNLFLLFSIEKYQWIGNIIERIIQQINDLLLSKKSNPTATNSDVMKLLERWMILLNSLITKYFQEFFQHFYFHLKEKNSLIFLIFISYLYEYSSDVNISKKKLQQQKNIFWEKYFDLEENNQRKKSSSSSLSSSSSKNYFVINLFLIIYCLEEQLSQCFQRLLLNSSSSASLWREFLSNGIPVMKMNRKNIQQSSTLFLNKYFFMKYFERINFHLNELSLTSSASSCQFSDHQVDGTLIRHYSVQSFDVLLPSSFPSPHNLFMKNLSDYHQKKGFSFEFLWNIVIFSSQLFYSMRSVMTLLPSSLSIPSSPSLPHPQGNSLLAAAGNDWFLLKAFFQQLAKQIDFLKKFYHEKLLPYHQQSDYVDDLHEEYLNDYQFFHREVKRITHQLLSSYQRLSKLMQIWDQPFEGMELFFSSLSSTFFELFEFYSPFVTKSASDREENEAGEVTGTGAPLAGNRKSAQFEQENEVPEDSFNSKVLLIISHFLYNEKNKKDQSFRRRKKKNRRNFLEERKVLHERLSFIVRRLFLSYNFAPPPSLSSSSSSASSLRGKTENYGEDEEDPEELPTAEEEEDENSLPSSTSLIASFQSIFQNLLLSSIISPSSTTSSTPVTNQDLTKRKQFQFDFIAYRKLKSLLLKYKKKLFLELLSTKKLFSIGLMILSMIQELIIIFHGKIIQQEMSLLKDILNMIIEIPSFQSSMIDQLKELQLRKDNLLAWKVQEMITTAGGGGKKEVAEQQRSILLLYCSLIIFHPLPIEIEFIFPNQSNPNQNNNNNNNNLFTPNYFNEEEFLLFIQRQRKEVHSKQLTSLTPYLTFLTMFHQLHVHLLATSHQQVVVPLKGSSSSFSSSSASLPENPVKKMIQKMERLFFTSLLSTLTILIHWKDATKPLLFIEEIEEEEQENEEKWKENQRKQLIEEEIIRLNALEVMNNNNHHPSQSIPSSERLKKKFFSFDFHLQSFPFALVQKQLQLIHFYFLHAIHAHHHQSTASIHAAAGGPMSAMSSMNWNVELFNALLFAMEIILSRLLDFYREEIEGKLLPFYEIMTRKKKQQQQQAQQYPGGAGNNHMDEDLLLMKEMNEYFCTEIILPFFEILEIIQSILGHEYFKFFIHFMKKKCHLFADSSSFKMNEDNTDDNNDEKDERELNEELIENFMFIQKNKRKANPSISRPSSSSSFHSSSNKSMNLIYFRKLHYFHSLQLISEIFASQLILLMKWKYFMANHFLSYQDTMRNYNNHNNNYHSDGSHNSNQWNIVFGKFQSLQVDSAFANIQKIYQLSSYTVVGGGGFQKNSSTYNSNLKNTNSSSSAAAGGGGSGGNQGDDEFFFIQEIFKFFFFQHLLLSLSSSSSPSSSPSSSSGIADHSSLIQLPRSLIYSEEKYFYETILQGYLPLMISVWISLGLILENKSNLLPVSDWKDFLGIHLQQTIRQFSSSSSSVYPSWSIRCLERSILSFNPPPTSRQQQQQQQQQQLGVLSSVFHFLSLYFHSIPQAFTRISLLKSSSSAATTSLPLLSSGEQEQSSSLLEKEFFQFIENFLFQLFKSMHFLRLSSFHSNQLEKIQQMIRSISSYHGLFSVFLQNNQTISFHPSSTTPSTSSSSSSSSSTMKLVSLSQLSNFFEDFLYPFINELLAALFQCISSSITTQTTSMNNTFPVILPINLVDQYFELIHCYLPWMFQFPFATRCKEWEIFLFPLLLVISFRPYLGPSSTTTAGNHQPMEGNHINHNNNHQGDQREKIRLFFENFQEKTIVQLVLLLSCKIPRQQQAEDDERSVEVEGEGDREVAQKRQLIEIFSQNSSLKKISENLLMEVIDRQFRLNKAQRMISMKLFPSTTSQNYQQQRKDFEQYLLSESFQIQYSLFHSFIQGIVQSMTNAPPLPATAHRPRQMNLPLYLQELAIQQALQLFKQQFRLLIAHLPSEQ